MKTRFYARRAYRAALIASAWMDDMLLLYMPLGIIVAVSAALTFVHFYRG
jgi:hypothetical protein